VVYSGVYNVLAQLLPDIGVLSEPELIGGTVEIISTKRPPLTPILARFKSNRTGAKIHPNNPFCYSAGQPYEKRDDLKIHPTV
jgi:hypothetical protein